MMQKHSIARAVAGARWNPRDGLIASDQGLWLDPSDLATMFQASAGTTPVTAVEQPVGLILDKSKGLVLGPELVDTANTAAAWTPSSLNIVTQDGDAVKIETVDNPIGATILLNQIGGLSVDMVSNGWYVLTAEVKINTGSAQVLVINGGNGTPNVTLTSTAYIPIKFYVLKTTSNDITLRFNGLSSPETVWIRNISVKELPGNHAFQSTSANRPTFSARYNQYVGTEAMATQNVTTLATSYKLTFSGAGSITLSGAATGTYTAGTYTVTCTAGTLTSTVSGSVTQASLVQVNQSSLPYQRVNTATDYDSDATKFPWYLKFNGTSSSLQTASINFTATDKMFVSAGVRKLSDAAAAILTELSATAITNNGSFYFTAPENILAAGNYVSFSHGTASVNTQQAAKSTVILSPNTSVLTATHDIAGDLSELRINGSANGTNGVYDKGSGNFGNYPLYVGARAGTSLFFNGNLYQLVICGRPTAVPIDQITRTEEFVNRKTKAY